MSDLPHAFPPLANHASPVHTATQIRAALSPSMHAAQLPLSMFISHRHQAIMCNDARVINHAMCMFICKRPNKIIVIFFANLPARTNLIPVDVMPMQ